MKMKYYFAAIATLMLGACSQENLLNENNSNDLIASIESESRISIEGLKVNWSTNDAFSAFSAEKTLTPTIFDYKLTSGDQTSSAKFTAVTPVTGTMAYAIFPAIKEEEKSELTLQNVAAKKKDFVLYYLPQEYKANELPAALPMVGSIIDGNVSFKVASAVLKLTINNLDAKYTKIKVTSEEDKKPLAGDTRLGFEDIAKGNIKWIMDKEANGKKPVFHNSITIGRATGQSEFLIPIPVSDTGYAGLTISANDGTKDVDLFKISKVGDKGSNAVSAGHLYTVAPQDAKGK